jgi:PmbA protein
VEIKNTSDFALALKLLNREFGVSRSDLFGVVSAHVRAKVLSGKPHDRAASQRCGVTLRVWNSETSIGVTSLNTWSYSELRNSFQKATEVALLNVNDTSANLLNEDEEIGVLQRSKSVGSYPFEEIGSQFESFQLMTDWLLQSEEEILKAHELIHSLPYNVCSQDESVTFYVNSEGVTKEKHNSSSSAYFYTKTSGSKPRSAGFDVKFKTLAEVLNSNLVSETIQRTLQQIDYAPIKTGNYKTIFSGEAFLQLLYAFGNFANGQRVLDAQSLCKADQIGTEIASKLLTIEDDAMNELNVAQCHFDGEGRPTQKTRIIENGVLQQFLQSSVSAKKMNCKSTGNGRLGAKVNVSARFLAVLPGEFKLEDLVSNKESYVFVQELSALHAGVNEIQGSFSLPFSGYFFNGSSRKGIELATVAGDFMTLLQHVVGVGKKVEVKASGLAPYICVDKLSITSGSA